jgi:pyrroloquinoline quinone (PQQ) biosynthesis protein C
MALPPAEFARALLKEAQETHPWLHHPPASTLDFYYVHMEVEADHADRAVRIVEKLAVTDADQARGLLGMRRAITARRICADGLLEAFARPSA